MYPSDYGYAVGRNVRNTCLEINLLSYNSNNCYTNDWLYLNGVDQWTLTSHGSSATYTFVLRNTGILNGGIVNGNSFAVRPVLYLNSNIEIIADENHDGSQEHPYGLKLGE